ncbi:Copine-domain-containing protein [Gonapodya prolifera JEL478]|uniref:Copine-domain-containing protein n=1 Tax=Gonapodya prolifera (strain JEL478) TaxID=1344416 RepID=A0A139AR74_GONPJ|nr:Copine-domain-containing protein [Gonapodya prolifera JEL478]|eukprot:KXS19023.1 Copine-domain-containing protein [Gonapodya prolifera JEL478]
MSYPYSTDQHPPLQNWAPPVHPTQNHQCAQQQQQPNPHAHQAQSYYQPYFSPPGQQYAPPPPHAQQYPPSSQPHSTYPPPHVQHQQYAAPPISYLPPPSQQLPSALVYPPATGPPPSYPTQYTQTPLATQYQTYQTSPGQFTTKTSSAPPPRNAPPIMPQAKVELHISCTNLPSKDVLSKSDPRVHVFLETFVSEHVGAGAGLHRRSTFVRQWTEIGVTEIIKDNRNPKFSTAISASYFFELTQLLRFVVVDIDDYRPGAPPQEQDYIGYVEAPLATIVQGSHARRFERPLIGEVPPGMGFRPSGMVHSNTITAAQATAGGVRFNSGANELTPGARGALPPAASGARNLATIRVSAEEVLDAQSEAARIVYKFRIKCENLDKKDLFGASDAYVVLSKPRSGGEGAHTGQGDWVVVHKTEVVMNNANPTFREFEIPAVKLNGGDPNRQLLWEVWEWDKNSPDDLIGQFKASAREVLGSDKATGGKRYELINEKKQARKGKSYSNSGILYVDYFAEQRQPLFMDYIAGGCELSLAISVDFTASNGDPQQMGSLHYRDPFGQLNSYQRALLGVGQVLEAYDSDKCFPAYGFGAKILVPTSNDYLVSHLFPLNLNMSNPHVVGVNGLLEAYGISLNRVVLHGPTNFAPTLRSVNAWARDGYVPGERILRRYSVLLIVTDGAVSDVDDTIAAIVDASTLPLSIIIVGVGNADFSSMELFDADRGMLRSGNRVAERDVVQFVPFRDFPHEVTLSQATLAEVPKQFLEFCRKRDLFPFSAQ